EERQARSALVEMSIQLNSLLNLPELLQAIIGAAARLLKAETSSLLLRDEATNELEFTVATDLNGDRVKHLRVPANQGIAGWVLDNEKPQIVNDVAADPRFYGPIDQLTGFKTRSVLAVPLTSRDRTIG